MTKLLDRILGTDWAKVAREAIKVLAVGIAAIVISDGVLSSDIEVWRNAIGGAVPAAALVLWRAVTD